MTSPVILTTDRALTNEARAELSRQVADWRVNGRDKPLVLDEGLRISNLASVVIHVRLKEGPLDSIVFDLHLDDLADLPDALTSDGGRYVRWINDAGQQMVTTEGGLCYRWVAP